MSKEKRKRRIMREFTIKELSAVDRPAQGHALMTMMKREDEKDNDIRVENIARDEPRVFHTFEQAVAHLREFRECSGTEALRAAREQYPRLLAKYNAEGADAVAEASARKVALNTAKLSSQAKQEWDLLVEGIMARRGVKRTVAMQIARRENPGKFRVYQES